MVLRVGIPAAAMVDAQETGRSSAESLRAVVEGWKAQEMILAMRSRTRVRVGRSRSELSSPFVPL